MVFSFSLRTPPVFNSLQGRSLILNVPSVLLGTQVCWTQVSDALPGPPHLSDLSGCIFVPKGDFRPHHSGWPLALVWPAGNAREPTPCRTPQPMPLGGKTPAPHPPAGGTTLAALPSMEAGFTVSLDWVAPLPCILSAPLTCSSQTKYLHWSLCPLLEEPKLRQHMALTQYLWKRRILI